MAVVLRNAAEAWRLALNSSNVSPVALLSTTMDQQNARRWLFKYLSGDALRNGTAELPVPDVTVLFDYLLMRGDCPFGWRKVLSEP